MTKIIESDFIEYSSLSITTMNGIKMGELCMVYMYGVWNIWYLFQPWK
jgi:hypothetical protein